MHPEAAVMEGAALDRFLRALFLYGTPVALPSAQQARDEGTVEAARVAFEEYARVVKPACSPTDPRMQNVNITLIATALDEAVGGIVMK